MQENKFDEEMKTLSMGVYKENRKSLPKDWIELSESENKNTGFYAQAFYKDGKIAVVFRGTEPKDDKDILNDLGMAATQIPSQYIDAQNFYQKIKNDFPNHEIVFTGHSLGGSLAQLMSNKTGNEAVTFNAYGVGNLLDGNIISNIDKNIKNYGNVNDIVFNANLENQLGKTYVIGADDSGDFVSKFDSNERNKDLKWKKYHRLENIGDLKEAVEYKPARLEGGVEINVDKKDIDPNRIFTREELDNISSEEYLKKENIINQQLKEYGTILTEKEADTKVQSGDLIRVDGYTRSDGTKVSGYYRRK